MPDIPPRKSLMNPELRRRGIYVLPNLLTTAALFAGFYAIVQAMTGRFEHAAVAILSPWCSMDSMAGWRA
jgi:CDP-diacylglycerol--serine O-phosphatidyltransferase